MKFNLLAMEIWGHDSFSVLYKYSYQILFKIFDYMSQYFHIKNPEISLSINKHYTLIQSSSLDLEWE